MKPHPKAGKVAQDKIDKAVIHLATNPGAKYRDLMKVLACSESTARKALTQARCIIAQKSAERREMIETDTDDTLKRLAPRHVRLTERLLDTLEAKLAQVWDAEAREFIPFEVAVKGPDGELTTLEEVISVKELKTLVDSARGLQAYLEAATGDDVRKKREAQGAKTPALEGGKHQHIHFHGDGGQAGDRKAELEAMLAERIPVLSE